jgi:hypothetical protein
VLPWAAHGGTGSDFSVIGSNDQKVYAVQVHLLASAGLSSLNFWHHARRGQDSVPNMAPRLLLLGGKCHYMLNIVSRPKV